MAGYYISVSIKSVDAARVREAVSVVFKGENFWPLGEKPASAVVDGEEDLPDGTYGVLVSGVAGSGWVSLYVDDWQDSGFLAKRLSQSLAAPVLEVWVAEDVHWGYTYYENGAVRDRFADDPAQVVETEAEAALYRGQPDALASILRVPPGRFASALDDARAHAGQFAGGPIDALAQAVGVPFEHVFTGYDYFFDDDPEEYAEDLEDWPAFRHLAFQPPPGRETLAE